jgi:hypothetical protein
MKVLQFKLPVTTDYSTWHIHPRRLGSSVSLLKEPGTLMFVSLKAMLPDVFLATLKTLSSCTI